MSKKKKTEHFANVQYLFDHFILQMRNINKDIDETILAALGELHEAEEKLNSIKK
jgi:hypothetical protein